MNETHTIAIMPIPLIVHGFTEGLSSLAAPFALLKIAACIGFIYLLKRYFGGATNGSERVMHSKVVMVTVSGSHTFESRRLLTDSMIGRYIWYWR